MPFNNIGLPGLLLIGIVLLVLFGRGKISSMMGEVGRGITAFKKGMDDGRREIDDTTTTVVRDVTPDHETATVRETTTVRDATPAESARERI